MKIQTHRNEVCVQRQRLELCFYTSGNSRSHKKLEEAMKDSP